ncbi:hypothetical protein FHX52_1903 [Humibacillus xanthopallidus]|uniref:Uncharacterized protein n=1 Tax=Humibacillus xanthopallidus TaxID=412689 RepID=A0A543PXE5_9MICO|nr:hypothetical protein [Humibacillus xanthopallidus]TQN48757.1 hypothetical protein FHX52_1903 [Humibacillus xanthopallidus]
MSHNHDVTSTSPSRRSVVKGAAWAVPAVAVAAAAPTVAASVGLLSLTGNACKLPGSSNSVYKGYVFELKGNNVLGPQPRDAVVVVESIAVSGLASAGQFIVQAPTQGVCSCGPTCGGSDPNHTVCITDGSLDQQILIYTEAGLTGNSASGTVTITYRVYDCNNTANCGAAGDLITESKSFSGGSLPGNGQGSCTIMPRPIPPGS